MLKAHVEYGLEGAFKVDTFDKNGNFVETTDWFSNFITQTGLMYPSIYSFANCFRFLTIGSNGISRNTGAMVSNSRATTGCYSPISTYYVGTSESPIAQNGTYLGHTAYETGTLPINSACSTSMTSTGPIFFRAWGVPTGGMTVLSGANGDEALTIGEFMVSPSSGNDPIGKSAFSRIVRPFILKQGYRAVISYQLKVNIQNAALTHIPSGTFETGNANIDTDEDLITQWRHLSGFYRQVWCGLSCVDKWGVSFITKYGNLMEPSLSNLNDYYLYLSPDNAQFDVNPLSGGFQTDTSKAWASNGIMTPLVISSDALSPTTRDLGSAANQRLLFYGPEEQLDLPTTNTPFNIRLGSDLTPLKTVNLRYYTGDIAKGYVDTSFNYQSANRRVDASLETISYANPGGSGIRDGENGSNNRGSYEHEKAVFSTRIFKLPMEYIINTGNQYAFRKKTITRKAVFSPANNPGYNTRFGSMVLAYKLPDESETQGTYTFYPTIDSLFYDSSGRAQLQHYRQISGIYLTERGSGIINAQVDIIYQNPTGVADSNITRHVSLKTFQGPIVNGQPGPMTGFMSQSSFLTGNIWTGITSSLFGSGNLNYNDDSVGKGYSGWGSIYGTVDPFYNDGSKVYDVGIADHNTGIITDNHTGQLYWPSVLGRILGVRFTGIVFSGCTVGATPLTYTDQDDTTLAAMGFKLPSGVILHYDNIGITGYRLLPNYGSANITNTNIYPPSYGGALPALSMDNGLEVYFDISWSSECPPGVDECNPPP